MAVALGIAGGAAVTGFLAVRNAKKEISSVVNNKVQKRIDKKCAKLTEQEKATFAKLEKKREPAKEARMKLANDMRAKHHLSGSPAAAVGTHSGYLLKRGKINTAFKKRWFALENCRMRYSKEPSTEEKGTIDLRGAQVSLGTEGEEWQLRIVVLAGRTFVLQGEAPNPRSRLEAWMDAIEAGLAAGPAEDSDEDDGDDDGGDDD